MSKKLKIYGIYLPLLFVILPIVVILRTVACITNLENSGYFSSSILSDISNTIVLITVLFFLTYLFTARRNMSFIPSFSSALSYGPLGLVGASLLFLAVHLFTKGSLRGEDFLSKYTIIVGIAALLAISYFIACGLSIKRRSIRRADLGLIVLIFICIYITYIFFDRRTPINTPAKITDEVAYLSAALFFLYETRLSLGRERWRPYIAFGLIAALLTGYSAIPSLITYFVSGRVVSLSIYETVLTLSIFIFALFRVVLVRELVEERGSAIVHKIIAFSNERQEALNAIEEEAEADTDACDENQLSISDITIEAELIDAPTVEESFFSEPEPVPMEPTETVWTSPEDEVFMEQIAETSTEITEGEDSATIPQGNEEAE